MTKLLSLFLFFMFFVAAPIFLAWSQDVPTQSTYQSAVLYVSLGAFGLLLGQFWLSRLMPSGVTKMKTASVLRWHKYLGYTAGLIMLVHPVLMIARRFWVQQSNPVDNLIKVLSAPVMLPAIIAWICLLLIVFLAFFRYLFPARKWRLIHGILSIGFVSQATCHAVMVGRHSNSAMTAFWILLTISVVAMLFNSYFSATPKQTVSLNTGECYTHESL